MEGQKKWRKCGNANVSGIFNLLLGDERWKVFWLRKQTQKCFLDIISRHHRYMEEWDSKEEAEKLFLQRSLTLSTELAQCQNKQGAKKQVSKLDLRRVPAVFFSFHFNSTKSKMKYLVVTTFLNNISCYSFLLLSVMQPREAKIFSKVDDIICTHTKAN